MNAILANDEINNHFNSENLFVLPVKQRVLVVDDDPINRKIWAEVLAKVCRVEFAQTGEEALQKFEDNRPDLVVLDRMMPGMHGDEVLAKIREKDTLGTTKVIMHSMLEKSIDQIEGMTKGADLYIPKSTDIEVAVLQVQSLLHMQKASQASALYSVAKKQMLDGGTPVDSLNKGIFRQIELISEGIKTFKVDISKLTQKIVFATELEEHTPIVVLNKIERNTDSHILGNEELLFQAFNSVLSRAIAVTPTSGGVVTTLTVRNHNLVISIEDEGPSIPPSKRNQIFHLDYETDDPELSLPIAWEIAQRHYGDLVATDGLKGMVFTFSFPMANQLIEEDAAIN